MYTVTPKLRELPLNRELCRDCIAYVSKSGKVDRFCLISASSDH